MAVARTIQTREYLYLNLSPLHPKTASHDDDDQYYNSELNTSHLLQTAKMGNVRPCRLGHQIVKKKDKLTSATGSEGSLEARPQARHQGRR